MGTSVSSPYLDAVPPHGHLLLPRLLYAVVQGRTLIPFSAQGKRFLWDRGWIWGLFIGYSGGIMGYQGLSGVLGGIRGG